MHQALVGGRVGSGVTDGAGVDMVTVAPSQLDDMTCLKEE